MKRPSASRRGYGAKWRAARLRFLRLHPWCAFCRLAGRRVAATVVDHILPHRGDRRLFWSGSNWQALCSTCHNSAKQSAEKGGSVHVRGCDERGVPLDRGHHWRE